MSNKVVYLMWGLGGGVAGILYYVLISYYVKDFSFVGAIYLTLIDPVVWLSLLLTTLTTPFIGGLSYGLKNLITLVLLLGPHFIVGFLLGLFVGGLYLRLRQIPKGPS